MPPSDSASNEHATPRQEPRRRFRMRYAIPFAILVIAAYGVIAGMQLNEARSHLEAGSDRLSALDDELHDLLALISRPSPPQGGSEVSSEQETTDDMTLAAVQTELEHAAEDFTRAVDKLEAPLLKPVSVLPVLGRQLRVVDDLADASLVTTDALAHALVIIDAATKVEVQSPQERLDVAVEITAALEGLLDSLHSIELTEPEGLMTPVADAWNKFNRHFNRAFLGVTDAHAIAHGVTTFLSGPHDYLILAANNAEMQSGSGMFLQVGTLSVDAGVLTTGPFTPSEELYLAHAAGKLDSDIERNWGWLHPNQEWRNLNLSPRFDESARMALQMWHQAQDVGLVTTEAHDPVGVFALDIAGVQDLIELTGPVEVLSSNGEVEIVSAETVVADLTLEQYLADTSRGQRRERLGDISAAVFQALTERPIPAVDLIATIRSSGRERRLLIWSQDKVQQDAWEALQVGGTLEPNAVMLSLMNRGGNKLDPFMAVETTVHQSPATPHQRTGQTELSITVSVTNNAPPGLPQYVEGPLDAELAVAGEYRGILMLTLPAGARNLTTTGDSLAVRGADGPTNVIGVNIALKRGESLSVVFSSLLPETVQQVRLTPSARLPRTTWDLGKRTWNEYGPLNYAVNELPEP